METGGGRKGKVATQGKYKDHNLEGGTLLRDAIIQSGRRGPQLYLFDIEKCKKEVMADVRL